MKFATLPKLITKTHQRTASDNFQFFSADEDHVTKTARPACYVSKKPLDVLSDWACVECDHTINHERIRELEEIAFKIVNSGLNYCNRWYGI